MEDQYTPDQIDELEYDAWASSTEPMTDREYDLMMASQYANYIVPQRYYSDAIEEDFTSTIKPSFG